MHNQAVNSQNKSTIQVFVGVHCRRTDHILYEWRNSQSSVNYAYYLEAMDMFRNHFRYYKAINLLESQFF